MHATAASTSAMLVLDADGKEGAVKLGTIVKIFEEAGFECVIYSSPSNVDGRRFRVVTPLAEAVEPAVQGKAVRALYEFIS
jgi:hypothetical protein